MRADPISTFSDETRTGRDSESFQGLGRATIAASVHDINGFEWLIKFKREHAPNKAEMKSALVLEILKVNEEARKYVFDHICDSTIIIIDLSEHYRHTIEAIYAWLGLKPPARPTLTEFVGQGGTYRGLSRKILIHARNEVLYNTMVVKVEALLNSIISSVGIPHGPAGVLIDREELRKLDDRAFQELVARFSVAFADAMDPMKQADGIIRFMHQDDFLMKNYVGFVTLGEVASINRYFDTGNVVSFSLLQVAHEKVIKELNSVRSYYFNATVKGGAVVEEDSELLLGIQAADIAAGIAAQIYEKHPKDRYDGARAVKDVFTRVLLNDHWL